MLTRKVEVFTDPVLTKNLSFTMESIDGLVNVVKNHLINFRAPDQVTEIQKCADIQQLLRQMVKSGE